MTNKELKRYRWLCAELRRENARIEQLRLNATSAVSSWGGGGGGGKSISDKVGNNAVLIADLEAQMTEHVRQLKEEIQKLDSFLNTIDDPYIRLLFKLRYEDGLSWRQVAQRAGGYVSEATVRQSVHRYLQKQNKENNDA